MNDVNVTEFAEMLCYLEPHPEATERLDKWGTKSYRHQKAHMIDWFVSQTTTGSGSYTRKEPNTSARVTYNRLLAPGAMLWIADALGEGPERLQAAVQSAKEAEKNYWRDRGGGFRKVIPFSRIYQLYQHPENWKYDKRLRPYFGQGEDGYPVPTKNALWEELAKELW